MLFCVLRLGLQNQFIIETTCIQNLQSKFFFYFVLTLVMLDPDLSFFENTVDQDQLASDEAI